MDLNIIFCLYLISITELQSIFGKSVKIVGGKTANINDFPFLVSLTYRDNNKHTCGGAIISEYHILTAAHCVFKMDGYYNYIIIISGSTSLKKQTGKQYRLKKVYIHPNYTGRKTREAMNQHDIGIIQIEGYIEFNEYQQKAQLPTKNLRGGEIGVIAGWGLVKFPSVEYPDRLQKTLLKILKHSECLKTLPFNVLEDQFCTFGKIGVGVCVGDSGGPLIVREEIVGIISISLPCGQGIPDVFVKIYSHLDFIRSIIYG